MRDRVASWRDRVRVLTAMPTMAADAPSRRALLGLVRTGETSGAPEAPVAVCLRPLDGRPLHLRPGTSDVTMLGDDYVLGYHLPPRECRSRDLTRIWVLGANIGIGLVDLALRYPRAELVAVEPDPANVAVARRNVAGFAERCHLVEAAVWDEDGEVVVEGKQAYGLTVRARTDHDAAGIPAMSLNTLLTDHGADGPIEFMLMEIEGTERRVLARNTEWAERVETIKVALRPDLGYLAPECAADLRRLGFRTRIEPMWWGGFVVGVR